MENATYVLFMSDGTQQKIKDGSWRVLGLTIQDTKTGRIVANLKTVTNESESGYTPTMFLALNAPCGGVLWLLPEKAPGANKPSGALCRSG